jgi:hypothetical protein
LAFKKIISILVAVIIAISFTFLTASAQEDFTMKPFDKGYVTFIFDDGRMPFTKEVGELFKEYNMPMCCAMPGGRVQKDSELHKTLLKIQSNGGEILSHGYDHKPITSEERSKNPVKNVYGKGIYTLTDIEKELGSGWKRLTNLGFNVHGIIQVGCGGDESTADYALVESVARKYYKYSNASGISAQYKKNRTFMNWKSMNGIYDMIDKAIQNKEWIILSAHGYNEISNDAASEGTGTMREILEYIKSKNGEIEVVTWNYIYKTFGEYTGPAIPSAEAQNFLKVVDGDDVDSLAKDAYVEKPVTQSKPTEATSSVTSSQTNSVTSQTTSSTPETSQTQSTVTSSVETQAVQEDTQEDLNQTPKKKNNKGKIIAICAAAVALASVIAAVIVILKLK